MEGTVVVTGGGRGIGAATGRALARNFHICIAYRGDSAAAEAVVEEIRSMGRQALAIRADVGRAEDVEALFAAVDRDMPPLVGLVNNAAILGPQTRVDALDPDDLARVFATNVFGAFHAARAAVRRLSAVHGGRGGSIVNVSSVLSKLGAAGEYVHYAATKGAIEVFTLGFSREVAAEGIRVNAVRPGLTRTEMFMVNGDTERIERVAPQIPMRRAGEPEEIAAAVAWLMSPEASYVTGAVLDVGGGR
jgi:NAD(P)-dependent dehydrogenase (short-subunit alcohol dehydrogenase family)